MAGNDTLAIYSGVDQRQLVLPVLLRKPAKVVDAEQEWAGFMYVDRTTMSRKLPEWEEHGLIVCRNGGRLVRPRRRSLLDTGGLVQLFPQRHTHPGPEDDHEHDPLNPERKDHTHPTFFNGYAGALDLWERLELIPNPPMGGVKAGKLG